MTFLPLLAIAVVLTALSFAAGYLLSALDYEAGRIAGANEERSWRNRIVIRAKYQARADGIIYGCENHAALMSRRQGNVSGSPISQTISNDSGGVEASAGSMLASGASAPSWTRHAPTGRHSETWPVRESGMFPRNEINR